MKNLTVYFCYFLAIIGFAINTVNYGLMTDRISIGYFTGHPDIAYVGLSCIIAAVALFIYIILKKEKK